MSGFGKKIPEADKVMPQIKVINEKWHHLDILCRELVLVFKDDDIH